MITATKERPTAAELIQKHRQEVFTRYQEFIADIDRRMGNRAELKEAELEMAADSLIFNYFCFPYFEQCIKWKYDNFPNADAEFSNVTPFELTNTIVYPYIFSVFAATFRTGLSRFRNHVTAVFTRNQIAFRRFIFHYVLLIRPQGLRT